MTLKDLFIDTTTLPVGAYGFFQLLTLGCVYAYLLCYASNLISDGSELLLLVPAYASMVGSVVIPVLGAVPDGCIVLFSGMGENAAEELSVGVGVLAGSTIMLLTLPWFLSILGGRVDLTPDTNEPNYKTKLSLPDTDSCLSTNSLFHTGIGISSVIKSCSNIMVYTCTAYIIMQLCGLIYMYNVEDDVKLQSHQSMYDLVACISCWVFFVWYLYHQMNVSSSESSTQNFRRDKVMQDAVESGKISLLGLMSYEFSENKEMYLDMVKTFSKNLGTKNNNSSSSSSSSNSNNQSYNATENTPLTSLASTTGSVTGDVSLHRLERLLKPFFIRYDADNSGYLDMHELG